MIETSVLDLFFRGLSLINFFAFYSLYIQLPGLFYANGILPLSNIIEQYKKDTPEKKRYWVYPSLLWFNSSDVFQKILCICGMFISGVIFLGDFRFYYFILLYILYGSLVNLKTLFLSYQWDTALLEVNILTSLLCLSNNFMTELTFSIFFIRFMVSAGLAKLTSGDKNWLELKSMNYHYWTQPIPNRISFYANLLPEIYQKISCLIMLGIETILPLFLLYSKTTIIYKIALYSQILLQVSIMLTGNYGFFNLLTIVMTIPFFESIPNWVETIISYHLSLGFYHLSMIISIGFVYYNLFTFYSQYGNKLFNIGLKLCNVEQEQYKHLLEYSNKFFSYIQLKYINNFYIFNPYGLFAVMTTKRNEITIEGSMDGENWKEYEFKYKVSPSFDRELFNTTPHMPRLDWQLWFASLGNLQNNQWLINVVVRLSQNNKNVINLFKNNPFPDVPPKYIICRVYKYEMNNYSEWKESGKVWNKSLLGNYTPVIEIK